MYHKYDVDLEIDVNSKAITADLNLTYFSRENNKKHIILYLYHNLEIYKLKGDNIKDFSIVEEKTKWSSFNYLGQKIEVNLYNSLNKGEKTDIKICYNGIFDSKGIEVKKSEKKEVFKMNRIEKGFVELGLYAPWFPLTENLVQPALFNTNININDDYEIVSRPETLKRNDRFIINQKKPFGDCTFIASNNLKFVEGDNTFIENKVYYLKESHKKVATKIKDFIGNLINYFNSNFGKIKQEKVNIVITPRKKGGAYFRPGFLVYSAQIVNVNELRIFTNLAHEIAHFWWNKARSSSWEDWLNESFANYSVLKAIKNKYGEKKYYDELKRYKEKSKNLPSIRGIKRDNSQKTFLTLYYKGAIKLIDLEEIIGEKNMMELFRKVHTQKINTTSQFLDVLEDFSSVEVAETFDSFLDE